LETGQESNETREWLTEPRYIVIEGPVGVGKTSLVNLLAKKFSARPILEIAEENPFLKKFYGDIRRYAFQTQFYFLLSRYRQQQDLSQQGLFDHTVVCDYLFAKDKIFAYMTLDDEELTLYEQIYPLLNARLIKPDVVIFLQATTDVLMEWIKLRHRDFEKGLSRQYVNDLNEAYNYFFFNYRETPLLVINTNSIDFVRNEGDLDDLARKITRMKGGVEYYTPMSSR
jgi:deoxyguanosine kinase